MPKNDETGAGSSYAPMDSIPARVLLRESEAAEHGFAAARKQARPGPQGGLIIGRVRRSCAPWPFDDRRHSRKFEGRRRESSR